jgi:arylsulfatase A-like enzyme
MKTYKSMTRRDFVVATGAASTSLLLNGCEQPAKAISGQSGKVWKKPNIVFVFADQLRYTAMGCCGNEIVKTPNFDRMASQGIIFDNCCANHPLCSPYRANLITGKYGFANGVPDNEYLLWDNQVTLPRALKPVGYNTAFIGKWHLGHGPYPEDGRHGFDYMAAYNCQHSYYKTTYHENETDKMRIQKFAPEGETDLAIKFMENHLAKKDSNPFALFMGWGPPHWPYDQYPEECKIYHPAKVDLPPNVPPQMAHFARREIADYYGNVTAIDAQMGRLMATLDRLGIADDTILCFSSDHGDHLSSHGYVKPMDRWMHSSMRASKSTPYDEACHIPFIMRYPRSVSAGQRTRAMFSTVDVMPTLLALCGMGIPAGVQGHNLAHVATGKDGPAPPDSVYMMNMGPGWPNRRRWVGFWRGIRTDKYVYARWLDKDEHRTLLFNCADDPFEMKNLEGHKEYAQVKKDMEERLQQWIKDTNDPFETGKRKPPYNMLDMNFKLQKQWHGRELKDYF